MPREDLQDAGNKEAEMWVKGSRDVNDGEAEMWVMGKQTYTTAYLAARRKDPAVDNDGTA